MIKSLKKIGIISIVMCLILSLNCYAVGGDKIDPDGITTGSANLTNEQSILITNNIRYQMYIKENQDAYGDLANITADKVQQAIEACNAAGYQPDKEDVDIYISNNPNVIKEIPKKTDDGKMVFTYGNGQSVSSKIVTNEDSDKFAVINSAVGSAVDAVQKVNAEKNVIDKILSQNNFDLAENSGLGSLFGVITTAEEMAEYLNRDDITPEARKAFQEAMKAGQGAAGILYFKDPEVNKFVAQIGCKSPTDFLAYLDSKKKDEGLIGSIWQNTDKSSASGTYNFLKTAAEIQSFYGKLCAAMYQSSNGSKVTIENGEKEGFLFENGILIGIPQETIDEMEKNGSGTIEISDEMRKAFEIILNGIGKDINVGALKDLLNKNPWTIKELTAFQKLTGAEKIKGSDEAYNILYKGETIDTLNEGIKVPNETHTYLEKITYSIKKSDGSKFDKVCMRWDNELMMKYINSLKTFGGEGKSAAEVYEKWLTAIEYFNTANGTSIAKKFPNIELKNSGTALTGEMNFEEYISNNLGGNIDKNVLIQDFFRNFYSDISGKYAGIYRQNSLDFYRLAIPHSFNTHYARQNVDLSYISCPMAFKLDSGTLVYGYEILVIAHLKQIINESAYIISSATNTYSSTGQTLQWFPYRQYVVEKDECENIDKTFTYEQIQKMFVNPNLANITSDKLAAQQYFSNTSVINFFASIDESAGFRITALKCKDDTHSNLNLGGIDTLKTNASIGVPSTQGTTLHFHHVTPHLCKTEKAIKASAGEALINKAASWQNYDVVKDIKEKLNNNGVSINNLCGGWIINMSECDNHDALNNDVTHYDEKNKKEVVDDYAHICEKCGGSQYEKKYLVSISSNILTNDKWNSHKYDCFEIANLGENTATNFITSTNKYVGVKDCDIDKLYVKDEKYGTTRISKVVDYTTRKWKYKGKIYTWGDSDGTIIIFDSIIKGEGVQVENFISM